ncbi:hypothetical protein FKX85_15265 [Echinicola soli]|uniref:Uncharacterized protein n=1 Tax=Echinicola soli TaxID=2591634 RepID=A0A514CKI2_9BACT|nr:DUF6660 family protein [Echinicola soli]QDH80322.1 hypothetical protein FKX85_15265 [Echinicola soli]
MMKIIQVILSYYLLILVVLPCADEHSAVVSDNQDTVVVALEDHHSHGSDADYCSPLCVCHCCHIHYVVTDKPQVNFMNQFTSIHSSHFNDFKGIHSFDFLKPPKRFSPLTHLG